MRAGIVHESPKTFEEVVSGSSIHPAFLKPLLSTAPHKCYKVYLNAVAHFFFASCFECGGTCFVCFFFLYRRGNVVLNHDVMWTSALKREVKQTSPIVLH